MNRLDCYTSSTPFTDRWLERAFGSRAPVIREYLEEKEDAFVLRLDLPGLRKEELKIETKDRVLTLAVTPADERPFTFSGSRSWKLGPDLDADALSARLENGVLELTLPKRTPATVEPRTIQIL